MTGKNRKLFWCSLLLCVNLVFIWGNSLIPGDESGQFSQSVMESIEKLANLPVLDKLSIPICWAINGILDSTGLNGLTGGMLLRKAAHFTEFFCLGFLLCRFFLLLGQKGVHRFTMPQFCGMLAAFVDETIQLFSPGRAGSVADVWIDTAGVFVGVMLMLQISNRIQKKRSKNGGK